MVTDYIFQFIRGLAMEGIPPGPMTLLVSKEVFFAFLSEIPSVYWDPKGTNEKNSIDSISFETQLGNLTILRRDHVEDDSKQL